MTAIPGLVEAFQERSGELSFLDRLDDFRGKLISSLVAVVIATGVGFYVAAWPIHFHVPRWTIDLGGLGQLRVGGWDIIVDVLSAMIAPVRPFIGDQSLKYLSPTDPFFITLKLALCIGIALALPYLLLQVWRLIAPLLRPPERRLVGPAIIGGVALFAIGVLFCYFFVLPLMLRFMLGFQTASLEQSIVIGDYLKLILRMMVVFGLTFEMPIIVLIGTVLGLVSPESLASHRRHAIALFTIASAIITPPDVGSLVLLLIPVLLLYEISIWLSRAVATRGAVATREA